MHGIVSLLDDRHTELVGKLWVEMARQFGVANAAEMFVPHFSYHVAESYDVGRLNGVLDEVARETAVFTIQTAGVAVFPGPEPVIYIPAARHLALTQLHERLWTAVTPISQGSVDHYAPAGWLPHITLAFRNVTLDKLGSVVTWLQGQSIAWTIPIDNLVLVYDNNGRHEVHYRSAFRRA